MSAIPLSRPFRLPCEEPLAFRFRTVLHVLHISRFALAFPRRIAMCAPFTDT